MINDQKFNKYFGAFIMIGMSIAVCTVTAIKLGSAEAGKALLLLSAFGSLMGVVGTVTSATGHIITFLFGFFDVSVYGVVCLINWYNGGAGLGNGLLHLVYFVPMQFVGLYQWKRRESSKGQVQARRFSGRQWLLCIAVFAVLSVGIYFLLSRFDRSAATSFLKLAVILDTLPVVCNIIGQFLMSTAYMEQWIFWIAVNIASIVLWTNSYIKSGDSFTLIYIIKYIFYLLNCCNGLRIWYNLSDPKKQAILQNEK